MKTKVHLTRIADDFTGKAGFVVKVKEDESGFELGIAGSGDSTVKGFTDLTDTPASLGGHGGQVLIVSADASSIDFSDLESALSKGSPIGIVRFYDASLDQTYFAFDFTYRPTKQELMVFSSGMFMTNTVDYTENDETSIVFLSGREESETVTVIKVELIAAVFGDITYSGGFLDLTDTPNTYVGMRGKILSVTDDATALMFMDLTSAGGDPIANSITYDSSSDQTNYPLNFSYLPGHRELLVFSGGLFMRQDEDYTEYDTTSIKFFIGRSEGEKVSIVKLSMKNINAGSDPFTDVDVNNDYTCLSSFVRLFCDSSSNSFNVTFPLHPIAGDEIEIINATNSFENNNVILIGNGKKISGSLSNFVLDVNMGTL